MITTNSHAFLYVNWGKNVLQLYLSPGLLLPALMSWTLTGLCSKQLSDAVFLKI